MKQVTSGLKTVNYFGIELQMKYQLILRDATEMMWEQYASPAEFSYFHCLYGDFICRHCNRRGGSK